MAVLTLKNFGGISPKTPPRYLQDHQAQVAINCPVFNGPIQPLRDVGPTVATASKSGTPQTIYRFGQDTISDSEHWFNWPFDVDVCRSQIAGDTSEWTFYTGDGCPKATYAALALSGANLPAVSRPLGIPAPSSPAAVSVNGEPEDETVLPETRVYVYTNVMKEAGFEKESAPSPASTPVDVSLGQSANLTSFASTPSGHNITHRRIYRAVSGAYLFVAEISVSASNFTDAVPPEELAEELPSLIWDEPPADLCGLTNLPNGIMAGFVGRDVYFCEPYRPYAWPADYSVSLDYPIVGLGRMDTTLAALTTGTPYFVQGSHPDSMVVVKSDLEQACASKRSIVSTNGAVFYASPDGLVMLSSGGSRLVTERLFTRDQWEAYFNPRSIHAYQHDLKYIAFYDNGTTRGGFIYDLTTEQFVMHDVYAEAGYADLQVDRLFVALGDRSIHAWDAGDPLAYRWRSKVLGMPYPMSFSCAQVEASGYPVAVQITAGGTVVHEQVVQDRRPFRLPVAVERDWEIQVEGVAEVFAISMAQSMGELSGV